jgi:hypothetical protein
MTNTDLAVQEAFDRVARVLSEARRPAILFSGGKDSMVLCRIAAVLERRVDLVLFRLPWNTAATQFAPRMAGILGWPLHVLPASRVWAQQGGAGVELVADYHIGRGQACTSPLNTIHDDSACAIQLVQDTPLGRIDLPFDVYLHGHKSCDVDATLGPVPLASDAITLPSGIRLEFPLRHVTDDQVWGLLEDWSALSGHDTWDPLRYANRTELPDKSHNPDYVRCCTRCLDKRQPRFVACPMTGTINNVSATHTAVPATTHYITTS